MSVEANKKLVLSFFENFSAGKAETFLAQMTDTATWEVILKPGELPIPGMMTKAQFGELIQGIGAEFPKGLRLTPKALTAEGDRVAVEAEGYGETTKGKVYNNRYHFLIEVQDGKIQAVREYTDTIHAKDVLFG